MASVLAMGSSLLHTTGELVGILVFKAFQSYLLQVFHGFCSQFLFGKSREILLNAKFNIFSYGHPWKERIVLEYHASVFSSSSCLLSVDQKGFRSWDC